VTWLEANGLPVDILDKQQHLPSLQVQALNASAAMAGAGVALLTPAYYRREIEEGRLVQPFEQVIDEGNSYWLAYPESRRNVPKIKHFREWIVAEAAKE
jgi:LysR family glycine cleavage system transcriptional activator